MPNTIYTTTKAARSWRLPNLPIPERGRSRHSSFPGISARNSSVSADRVTLGTEDNDAAIHALDDHFGIEATVAEGAVTFHVESGEAFVPRLFAELDVAITSVSVSRPTLDDVFMRYTGTTIRDAETDGVAESNRAMMRAMAGARR